MMITWQQMLRCKPRQSINYPQTTTFDFVFNLKEQTYLNHARCIEYHINLALIAQHCMGDQFEKQNLVHRFMSPIWQLAKNLACEFCVFLLSVTTPAVSLWFCNLCTTTRSNFWLLYSAHALRNFQAVTAQLAILPSPCLWWTGLPLTHICVS